MFIKHCSCCIVHCSGGKISKMQIGQARNVTCLLFVPLILSVVGIVALFLTVKHYHLLSVYCFYMNGVKWK